MKTLRVLARRSAIVGSALAALFYMVYFGIIGAISAMRYGQNPLLNGLGDGILAGLIAGGILLCVALPGSFILSFMVIPLWLRITPVTLPALLTIITVTWLLIILALSTGPEGPSLETGLTLGYTSGIGWLSFLAATAYLWPRRHD